MPVGKRQCPLRLRRDEYRARAGVRGVIPFLCPCQVADVSVREQASVMLGDMTREDPDWAWVVGRLLGLFPGERSDR